MHKKRPVNLNLITIQFPITAISSILHRVSGFLLFLLIPFMLWGFSFSLSPEGFAHIVDLQACWITRFIEWIALSGLIYHLVAGLRHLCMDAGYFEEKISGRISAWGVIIVSVVCIAVAGGWLL